MLLKSFEMDARRAGIQQGIDRGSYQKACETAKLMKLKNFDLVLIKEISGLSIEKIENLYLAVCKKTGIRYHSGYNTVRNGYYECI